MILSGIPTMEGLYPRTSSNELKIRLAENVLDSRVARATITLMGASVFSSLSLLRIDFTVPILRSTMPVLLWRLAGRGLNWISWVRRYECVAFLLYSSSADTALGAPCRQTYVRSISLVKTSAWRLSTIATSENPVPVSVMIRLINFVPLIVMKKKST